MALRWFLKLYLLSILFFGVLTSFSIASDLLPELNRGLPSTLEQAAAIPAASKHISNLTLTPDGELSKVYHDEEDDMAKRIEPEPIEKAADEHTGVDSETTIQEDTDRKVEAETECESKKETSSSETLRKKRVPNVRIKSLLPNTEYCTEELSKLLDFNSIVSSSCGVDALKKLRGWLNKHKNSLPYWPSVRIPPPKNLITFYGCDWTICEREVENQIDQKLKKLHLPVRQIGNSNQSDSRTHDTAKHAFDMQMRNGNMSRGELLNSVGIWWCQKALPQLITDKETAYHSIFKEFNVSFDQSSSESSYSEQESKSEASISERQDNIETADNLHQIHEDSKLSVRVADIASKQTKDNLKYPNKLVFLKTALIPPMNCYTIQPEKDSKTTREELREIIDLERNRLESNLAFAVQVGTSIWRSEKTFSPLGKSVASIKRLIATVRIYTEEIRRDLFKLFPYSDDDLETAPPPPRGPGNLDHRNMQDTIYY
ncbi:hypothetical protein HWI79_2094 [Cryptosporidium felis]|nr:hypothetical protein HWI79_2094 [Cryptosporidium felis]